MTREHKLALIVGFSLVLLVGVLISDHVSSSRRQPINQVATSEGVVTPSLTGGTLPDPMRVLDLPGEPSPQREFAQLASSAVSSGSAPLAGPGGTPIASPTLPAPVPETAAPMKIAQGPSRTSPLPQSSVVDAPLVDRVRDEVHRGLAKAVQTQGGEIVDRGDGSPAVIRLPSASSGTSAQAATSASFTQQRPAEPRIEQVRVHVVARGDTLFEVARRYYGNGHAWRKLAEYNKVRGGAVQIGQRLRIPPAEVLGIAVAAADTKDGQQPAPATRQASAAPARPAADAAPSRGEATSAASTPRRDAREAAPREQRPNQRPSQPAAGEGRPRIELATYTVRKGDTLGDIAQRTLGSSRRWRELAEHNNLKDADDLPAGKVLRIPARRG